MSSLKNQIKANKSRVFRRLFMKRRDATTGLFETTWNNISSDVIKWGKLKTSIDEKQYNKFKFSGARVQLANDSGRYNPEDNPSSLWFGYLSPQRSLIRVEAGFVHETLGSDGIWTRSEFPSEITETTSPGYSVDMSSPSQVTMKEFSYHAVSYTSGSQQTMIDSIRIPLTAFLSLSGQVYVDVYEGTSITTGTLVATSDGVSASALPTSGTNLTTGGGTLFNFTNSYDKKPNTTYYYALNPFSINFTASASILWIYDSASSSQPFFFSGNSGTSYSTFAFGAGWSLSLTVSTVTAAFTGFVSGDIPTSGKNVVQLNVQPLLDLFRHYPARLLDGWTSTGLTASQFVESVRDHTDGSGSHVFLPFFGDTTTGFDIQSTTIQYGFLNTATATEVVSANIWSLIEKLAQAETFVPFVTPGGQFRFVGRDAATATTFEFHGAKSKDREYGLTIKQIKKFGIKYSKYYPRVDVQWSNADTETSIATEESLFQVTGDNLPWIYGHKTLKQEILFIQDQSTAAEVATAVFNDVSALRNEIEFDASFVPQLEILDRITLTYNNATFNEGSLWDLNNWSDTAGAALTGNELIWDAQSGDAMKLDNEEFKLLKIELDLDKLSTKITARDAQ